MQSNGGSQSGINLSSLHPYKTDTNLPHKNHSKKFPFVFGGHIIFVKIILKKRFKMLPSYEYKNEHIIQYITNITIKVTKENFFQEPNPCKPRTQTQP